jgi:hypothetical protein
MIPVLCAGMIRSGSTLQYQLAAAIVERAGAGERLGWQSESELERTLEAIRDEPGFRVVKAHACTPGLAAWARSGAPVVCVHRDPREVAASLMRKHGIDLDELLSRRWIEGAIAAHEAWTSMPRVLVSRYDDLSRDPVSEAVRIAAFLAPGLGRPIGRDGIEAIGRDHALERQRERVGTIRAGAVPVSAAGEVRFGARDLLHEDHLSGPGEAPRLDRGQRRRIVDRFGSWMRSMGYDVDG